MREGCSCGAWCRGRRRDVLQWRSEHRCAASEPSGLAFSSGSSLVEAAWQPVGFVPDAT